MGEPVRILDLAKQMIRLSGRREEEIESVFPGSRGGEEVHEVLREAGDPLDGVNPERRRAGEGVRGPVCILAGAGSGKTTTITRRIAQQVAAGAFARTELLAVTFTDKAAGELKGRLAALGAGGVRA